MYAVIPAAAGHQRGRAHARLVQPGAPMRPIVGALVIFHVPFRGNFLLLMFCAVLFLMTALGAGLFLSTISQTQQQANMMSFFFTTPAFMLSGFTFPIRNMPVVVQYLTYLNPLRYFMEIVRGIFLKGVGFPVLWPKMLALFVYGVVVLGMSAARFPQEAGLAQQKPGV
jgi:ABC-2 type transport system permease protein